jgi:hypothetical protein
VKITRLSATSLRHLGLLLFSPFCCLHSLQAHCMPPRSLNSPRLHGPRFISSLASLPPLALPNTVHLSLKAGGRSPMPASLCLFLYLDPRLRGQMIWPLATYVISPTLTSPTPPPEQATPHEVHGPSSFLSLFLCSIACL